MATFGGLACSIIDGHRRGLKQRVETWEVPGLDNYGAHLLGKGDSGFSFVLKQYGDLSSVETWIGNVEAKQGSKITVVDSAGVTYPNLLVTRISQPTRIAEYGNGGFLAELTAEGIVI